MELFVHPWAMIFGGILISAPILIHLINRMRFKRLRWAAMEFLLKSQKRNRRKLIIEQLILLLLRILLVLLAAFLVARFVGAKSRSDEGTTHFILLDDTLSMDDSHKINKTAYSAFNKSKDEIVALVRVLEQAPTSQHLRVVTLSDPNPEKPLFDQVIKPSTRAELERDLATLQPTALHIHPLVGMRAASKFLKTKEKGLKVAHFFSDFRERDWVTGPQTSELIKEVDSLLNQNINLNLMDTANPFRSENKGMAVAHENLALVELRADMRVAAEQVPVDFVAVIQNFGSRAKASFLKVKVNGQEQFGATQPIPAVPGQQQTEIKFSLLFAKSKPAAGEKAPKDLKEREQQRRADREFQIVSVEIDDPEGGLQADNVRDMVIEVRRKVPVLLVDGNGPELADKPASDAFHLREAFKAARAYEVEWKLLSDLDKPDDQSELDLYPTIFLLNVSKIKEKRLRDRLDDYVRKGGSVVFCMGDKAELGFYNDILNGEYKGLFPVKIKSAAPPLEEAEKQYAKLEDPTPKIVMPKSDKEFSPVLRALEQQLRYLLIDRYYPTEEQKKWVGSGKPQVLVSLARRKDDPMIEKIKERAQNLMAEAARTVREVADVDRDYQKYVELLQGKDGRYSKLVLRDALESPNVCHHLVRAIDVMLQDPGVKGDPTKPSMPDLWAQKKMNQLAKEFEEVRALAQYGDPLVVADVHGKGKVVAFLTPAGTAPESDGKGGVVKWNEWGDGVVSLTYEVFMMDLQRYLIGEAESLNRSVGTEELRFEVEAALYDPTVEVRFKEQKVTPPPDLDADKDKPKLPVKPAPSDDGDKGPPRIDSVRMEPKAGEADTLVFRYSKFQKPGVYLFDFKPKAEAGDRAVALTRGYAYNIDALNESDLKRAGTDKLMRNRDGKDGKGKIVVRSPGDHEKVAKAKDPDLSETPWLYLLFLIILIAEQAMAVHLSFHVAGAEGTAAPRARAA